MEISIVIPVYNEAENIINLVLSINNVMQHSNENYEIIVVDDASTDTTLSVLCDLQKKLSCLRIIHHKFNCGQSTGLYTGIYAADGTIIVTLDGDGQNDPDNIPAMIQCFKRNQKNHVDMIAGYRKKRNDNALRRFSSKIANKIRSSLLKDNTPDTGCGLKIFYRSTFLLLPFFDHMHRFLPALVQRHGGKVISMEVNHLPRRYGESKYGVWNRLWVGIVDLAGVMWLNRRMKLAITEEMGRPGSSELESK